MKKCPKCGTILDDSKKSCYMCGTNLDSSSKIGFGDAIDAAVGSKVTKEADNVFNNGEDIKVKSKDVVNENNDSAFYGKNTDAYDVYGENINSLNNMKSADPEVKAAMEQKKENEKKAKEQKELEEKKAKELKEKKEKEEKEKAAKVAERQRLREEKLKEKEIKQATLDANTNGGILGLKKEDSDQVFASNVPKENVNPDINWGDNLSKRKNNKNNKNKSITISKSLIFNSFCVLVFIGMLIFCYFKFIREVPDETLEIGSLRYKISDEFELSSSDSNSRYYSYGDSCSLKINYGSTDNEDGYIDNYFDNQKKMFLEDGGYEAINETMTINDNKWEVMRIVEYVKSPGSTAGMTEITKYRYVSILYNNKFYTTVFVNLNNDSTCSAMYNNFIDSLEF